ncbi:hypothetical protein OSB04_016252 [Centaurea solstitialis]|uniref:Protein kinase domain-containing protein n=1 Tax=Centaurea solstitialis TaxID=347529 RepID=A0AA38TIR3_9ASTR|nr:hypothetical protein OSB04_016252 [Centaurea solstitialis]
MLPATPKEEEPLFRVEDQLCRRFSLDEIRSATQNFDDSLVVGRGGFGKVYKGFIKKDGSNTVVVAIKISNSMSSQGAPEFQTEVEMLSKIRHCNLVSLIGYCYEGKEMALVYEYMPQGALEDHLYKMHGCNCSKYAKELLVDWTTFTQALALNTGSYTVIEDFGLWARQDRSTNQTRTHVSTLVKGTFGYMDPRYFHTGNLTIKSDVYAFGVVMLEVLCGRPAVDTTLDEEQMGLAPWAQDCIRKGKLNNIIDSRLRGQISSNCLKDFARIACRCLDNNPNQRPTMSEIIGKLDAILSVQERQDSSIIEGKFIDKFQWFFGAKVDSKTNNMMASPPLSSEGEPNEKLNNAKVKTGKAKVDHGQKDVTETSYIESESSEESGWSGTDKNLKPFSYNVLKMATRNFRPNAVLGGNNGSVFKGWFDEQSFEAAKPGIGTIFAVKRLNEESDRYHKIWLAEMNHLSKLNHPNLVKLIGYCIEDDRRFLVYEFMNRGSLENHLFRRSSYFLPLSWNLRIKIVVGAAKGLAYIHNHESKTICCDITSSSILVDSDYNAKLSNLLWKKHEGLEPEYHQARPRLIVDELDAIEDVPRGNLTRYRSPMLRKSLSHLIHDNKIFVEHYVVAHNLIFENGGASFEGCSSPREEIFNFGVVLLEVFTGKRNIDYNRPAHEIIQVDFTGTSLDRKQGIKRIIDERIDGQYRTSVAIRFVLIMKRCLSIEPKDRPTANEVLKALEELQDIQKTAPSPRVGKVTSATNSTSANVQKS